MRRSVLFLPGNNPNLLINGSVLGADGIIFDLEDAVSPDDKDAARILVSHALGALKFDKCEIIIRINALDTKYWEKDLEAVVPLGPDMILPAKVGCAEDIFTLTKKIEEVEAKAGITKIVKLLPLIETALGLENSFAIASANKRVSALLLGAEDLTADLRAPRTREGAEIAYARGRIVCAARAAGVDVFDTPFTDVNDMEGLRQDALLARSLGFTGKAVISPRHVDLVNEAFSPTDREITYAHRVFDAIASAKEQGKGAISLDGKMIDAPIVERARIILETARELGKGNDHE
ncbi:citrate lyase subunit beta (Citrase beta chain) (Citrate(pro-3S)-lyase subunit beta) (Citryl-CoA lyase subunit) [Treponema primitia ZAS-2]|uniref:Citrate lyase subunit beta (Citrase beta chain) (Citrate(Pro-3S)-lyase subunit beta) (Citryl-CoA lyase subunit) n=1 Tax=Treponema primitia (strain ATCC BAA-887 / DSM 12427 / ZAS-2) TaxID=545694 RepID=F5YRE6_TREPZ|nr:CoA ester lyase [Treponema primitia]AEF86350.1 citrate lyase subunit beta (Citrase beta chain) (Citrate(pro-3S)-lyase subunit beta) (Citryl-CoA lyase subunit) [Treponema primitia ZAS-2]